MKILLFLLSLLSSSSLDSPDFHERDGESKRLKSLGYLALPYLLRAPTTPEGQWRWQEAADRLLPHPRYTAALATVAGTEGSEGAEYWAEDEWSCYLLARLIERTYPSLRIREWGKPVSWMALPRNALMGPNGFTGDSQTLLQDVQEMLTALETFRCGINQ